MKAELVERESEIVVTLTRTEARAVAKFLYWVFGSPNEAGISRETTHDLMVAIKRVLGDYGD